MVYIPDHLVDVDELMEGFEEQDYYILINAWVEHETELALLVQLDGGAEHWLPKSQIYYDNEDGISVKHTMVELEIPKWLAQKHNIEGY